MEVAGLGDRLASVRKKLEGQKRVSASGYSSLHLTAPASSRAAQLCKSSEHRHACTYRVPHTTGVPDIPFS
jgi:hypothetical protein